MKQFHQMNYTVLNNNEKLLSEVISFLRFPLIVGVVFIHSEPNIFYGEAQSEYFDFLYNLLSCVISGCSVPLFYLFSGFLFFKAGFSKQIYISNLRKRTRTILVPYVLWNLIVFGLLFASQYMSGTQELTRGMNSPLDFLNIFWAYRGYYPMCAQFWFLRDLMVMFLIAPIFYVAVKYLRAWPVVFLLVCWLTGFWFDVPGISMQAVFFFYLGAYFSLVKINFVLMSLQNIKYLVPLYLGCGIVFLYFADSGYESILYAVTKLIGSFTVLGITAYFINSGKWHVNLFLAEASFFIYAYHQVFLGMLTKRTLPFFINNKLELGMVASYIICPLIIIGVGILLYIIMKRFLPSVTAVLTGARTNQFVAQTRAC